MRNGLVMLSDKQGEMDEASSTVTTGTVTSVDRAEDTEAVVEPEVVEAILPEAVASAPAEVADIEASVGDSGTEAVEASALNDVDDVEVSAPEAIETPVAEVPAAPLPPPDGLTVTPPAPLDPYLQKLYRKGLVAHACFGSWSPDDVACGPCHARLDCVTKLSANLAAQEAARAAAVPAPPPAAILPGAAPASTAPMASIPAIPGASAVPPSPIAAPFIPKLDPAASAVGKNWLKL